MLRWTQVAGAKKVNLDFLPKLFQIFAFVAVLSKKRSLERFGIAEV